ncbi:MAG: hypothetical protein FJX03_06455 [Alphaproteobacteria bacterium]|nr:hypothetical protein [Alphaproteobacteria bacterium]
MSRKKRDLTEEEKSLWDRISQKIHPLPKNKKRKAPAPVTPYLPLRKKPEPLAFSQTSRTHREHLSPLSHRIQRVRNVKIDARIDLHGLTLEQARLKLAKFLIACQKRRDLWVLVITGKGRQNQEHDESGLPLLKKTLRDQVPQWLEDPVLHTVISAYTTATTQDGGNGALYVRLKRLK